MFIGEAENLIRVGNDLIYFQMKNLKKFGLALLAMGTMSVVFTSCSKVQGCMDADADNYDALAEEDDNSCVYSGSVVFWYGESAAEFLINDGATALTYYVDGQIVGSTSASVFWTGAPDCGQDASLTVTKDLGNAKNKSYTYSIEDQTGLEYWSGVANFTANTCVATELTE